MNRVKENLDKIEERINNKNDELRKLRQEKKRIKDAYLVKVGQQYINLLKLTNPEIEYEEVRDYLAKKIIEVRNKEKKVKDSKNTNGNFDLSTSQNDFN
ncbi:hypothetical protein [Ligilactobacillus salivarius]|uniref:Uncharacterized protein n=1 Tax=Ligilactobacillus salivarius TaxID=1624 RepID=A0A9X6S7T1_9LACO|nr:hypothetical protein [Ligilactobacillus salivarius]MBE7387609.1 hypothetical protein [Ligilactobacillus salivarius]MBE7391987.1 hypothetical protein [Ligilactobacillus salivarius]PAY25539.1 hypothetical protein A8C33_10495 [Ligilactobacillus salivarius]PAY27044.1 hypothetical protein A8C49_10250 [Ligilactobacillus salivarius]PAY28906.1 hypothetical protein A8C44_10470 [Ligilactobacillus salivarius]